MLSYEHSVVKRDDKSTTIQADSGLRFFTQ